MTDDGVLVTWRNMELKVLPHFLYRAMTKYPAFERYYFGEMPEERLRAWVRGRPGRAIKIYIAGHGGTGIDHITDDSETSTRTVVDLIDLIEYGLGDRATRKADCGACRIDMLACLFARTPDGRAASSPAARLHAGLAERGVFVDLVARTESIRVTRESGRMTNSPYMAHVPIAKHEGPEASKRGFYLPRIPYTKVLYTFDGDSRVARLNAYAKTPEGTDAYIEASTLDGRRLSWADHAVDRLLVEIHVKRTGVFGRGAKDVTDARERVLCGILAAYETERVPTNLKRSLAALVDGTGDRAETNFTTHRNPLSARVLESPPRKAALIRQLLAAYPQ
ncbi:hypothetical protein LDO31_12705 [Luteimonas sp. XNQY3]|nr:hypothetical protein [Luteimonas sp. XNQY3]MCD9007079.1 hypothetical protein [Luteimonas sp. XNQY3]